MWGWLTRSPRRNQLKQEPRNFCEDEHPVASYAEIPALVLFRYTFGGLSPSDAFLDRLVRKLNREDA